jgi:Right handed beta helix region
MNLSAPRLVRHVLGLLILTNLASAADYYLAQDGDDARLGTSAQTAWRTIDRIPVDELMPGDRILFQGGDRFGGSLTLKVSGLAGKPITISSFGQGRGMITPPPGLDAIRLNDANFIDIRNLCLIGNGPESEPFTGSGVAIVATTGQSTTLRISGLECADFPNSGISIAARPGAGYQDILIERADCHGNALAGLGSGGPVRGNTYSFSQLVVRDSSFHNNRGRPSKTNGHSGSGIVLGDCADSLIERCAAWGNGDLCNTKAGGPVGIWLWESTRTTIRACYSFANRTGKGIPDGGGFDLDGGCNGCVIEDCLSWRNDGSGYLLCQFSGARPMADNIIRNSWSIGDGRGHNNKALMTYGPMDGSLITNCTFIVDGAQGDVAVWRTNEGCRGLDLRGNFSLALNGAGMLGAAFPETTIFSSNRWSPATALTLPAGDAGYTPEANMSLPAVVDESWLARLPQPEGTVPAVEHRWSIIAVAAGCSGEFANRIGAVARPRYGPAKP